MARVDFCVLLMKLRKRFIYVHVAEMNCKTLLEGVREVTRLEYYRRRHWQRRAAHGNR